MTPDTEPLYKHDCDDCHYIGTCLYRESEVDVYWCNQEEPPMVVVRWGNEHVSEMGRDLEDADGETMLALVRFVMKGLKVVKDDE